MEQIVKALVNNLSQQCELHELLHGMAVSINQALREEKLDDVQKHIAQYDDLTGKAEDLEERRLAICDEIALKAGISRRHPNLTHILEKIPANLQSGLEEKRTALKQRAREIANINLSNKIILEQRLSHIAGMFDLIAKHSRPKPAGYQRGGAVDQSPSRITLVNRIA